MNMEMSANSQELFQRISKYWCLLLYTHLGLSGVHKPTFRLITAFNLKRCVFDPEAAIEFVCRIFKERIIWAAVRHH